MNKLMKELTKEVNTVAIAGHTNPDGDCVGSCMALYLYLTCEYPDKKIDVYLEKVKKEFSYIQGLNQVKYECEADKVYDLIITLDASSKDRIGVIAPIYEQAKRKLCIDHHISNLGFAQENHVVGGASSTCEVLYELLDENKISKPIAEALYTGMIHDTGVFQYSCTTSRTMQIAGILMDKGIDFSKIVDESFYQKSYVQNQILGRTIMESILVLNGKVIVGCVMQKQMDFYGITAMDLDGIVNQLRITKGVEVAIFLYERGNHEFKVSMRSNGKVDVQEIACFFGGGGHVRAAGCTMQGSMYDVINNLTPCIERQLIAEKES